MAHPSGSVSYDPSGRFSFCRGFILWFDWYVNSDNAAISFDGEIFTIGSVAYPNIVQYVQLRPPWWDWSSNFYTLDHLVQAYWYVILPSATEIPNSGLVVHFKFDPARGWGIQFQKESPDTIVHFTLPPTEPGYWLYPLR